MYCMKTCRKCEEQKPISAFSKDKSRKDGLQVYCKDCRKQYRSNNSESIKQYNKQWNEDNIEHKKLLQKQWYENNRENKQQYDRQYREENKENKQQYDRQWYVFNIDYKRQQQKQWRENNPGLNRAKQARRRAAKLHRTPPWSETAAIKDFYANCPDGHHVDHIIPLQGETVSGLHVLQNLRYLPAKENLVKSNTWDF